MFDTDSNNLEVIDPIILERQNTKKAAALLVESLASTESNGFKFETHEWIIDKMDAIEYLYPEKLTWKQPHAEPSEAVAILIKFVQERADIIRSSKGLSSLLTIRYFIKKYAIKQIECIEIQWKMKEEDEVPLVQNVFGIHYVG
ncbi:hypothetical protein OAD26_00180 [bacterium]|nr:hypothetical protein [bacterium]